MPQQLVLDLRDLSSARDPTRSQPRSLPPLVRRFGYVPNFDDWIPGDLLLFSTLHRGLTERQIVKTQLNLNYAEEDAQWHHAAIYIGDHYLCEARPGGVRYHPVVESIGPNVSLRVRRDKSLHQSDRFRLAIRALMRLSQPYSYLSITRALFRTVHPRRFVLVLRPKERAVICSQLYHEAYMEATGRILVQRADIAVVPAELSVTPHLDDVRTCWVRIAR